MTPRLALLLLIASFGNACKCPSSTDSDIYAPVAFQSADFWPPTTTGLSSDPLCSADCTYRFNYTGRTDTNWSGKPYGIKTNIFLCTLANGAKIEFFDGASASPYYTLTDCAQGSRIPATKIPQMTMKLTQNGAQPPAMFRALVQTRDARGELERSE